MPYYNDSKRLFLITVVAGPLLLAGCVGTRAPARPLPNPEPPSAAETAPTPERTPAERKTASEPIPVRADAPTRYVVKKGDTLWHIAGYFLDDPWYWPELWYTNPDIANPHLIYPGDVLELVWVDGQPQLRRARGERLSPRVRELPIGAAIPTIPLEAIRQFLDGPRLVSEAELEAAPYIVDFLDKRLLAGAGAEIYVRGAQPGGSRLFEVVRPGGPYIDPETDELIGFEAIPVGNAEILEFAAIATGTLTRTGREARTGDRLLPVAEAQNLAADFYPHAPEQAVDGRIISVFDGVAQIGQYEIVALNRGDVDGMERGHVLDVYRTGRETHDPHTGEQLNLPPLQAGTLMVFEVDDRVSFGLVMRATRAIHVGDSLRTPRGGS